MRDSCARALFEWSHAESTRLRIAKRYTVVSRHEHWAFNFYFICFFIKVEAWLLYTMDQIQSIMSHKSNTYKLNHRANQYYLLKFIRVIYDLRYSQLTAYRDRDNRKVVALRYDEELTIQLIPWIKTGYLFILKTIRTTSRALLFCLFWKHLNPHWTLLNTCIVNGKLLTPIATPLADPNRDYRI